MNILENVEAHKLLKILPTHGKDNIVRNDA